nr:RNA-directed DNA polymerase, eukaryota, reverse transcriptase zinc-binding domain protein [Tanacetum cinerariifolium]
MTRLELYRLRSMWVIIRLIMRVVQGQWINLTGTYFMVNVYGPHDTAAKVILWQKILSFIHQHNGRYVLFGDLNKVREESERFGSTCSITEAQTFNSFIDNSDLKEMMMGGRFFTWMNKSGSKMSKLDRFLISEEAMDNNSDLKAMVLDRLCRVPLHIKLKSTKQTLKSWNSAYKKNDMSRKQEVISLIQDIEVKIDASLASDSEKETRLQLLRELNDIERLESMDIVQKSRVKWEVEGDENTKRFPSKSHQRCYGWYTRQDTTKITSFKWENILASRKKSGLGIGSLKAFNQALLQKWRWRLHSNPNQLWDHVIKSKDAGFDHIPSTAKETWRNIVREWKMQWKRPIVSGRINAMWESLQAELQHVAPFEGQDETSASVKSFKTRVGNPINLMKSNDHVLYTCDVALHIWRLIEFGEGMASEVDVMAMKRRVPHRIRRVNSPPHYALRANGEWYDSNLDRILQVLHCFYLTLGLKINVQKSSLMGVGVNHNDIAKAVSKLGCCILKTPFKYLGVFVGSSTSKVRAWEDTLCKLKSRLFKWKSKTLSIGGRLTLLKVVLGATPIYAMSIYRVPKTVLNVMESLRNKFFNGSFF